MRVLMIVGSYPPEKCGVGDYSSILFTHLNNYEDYDIDIFTSDSIIKKNTKIKFDKLKWKITDIKFVVNSILKQNYDIVHLQFPSKAYRKSIAIIFIMLFLYLKKKKIVLTLHEFSYSPLIAKLRTIPLLFISKKIIVVDEKYKYDFKKISKKIYDKTIFINIASNIPLSRLNNNGSEKVEFRKKLFEDVKLVIGYFGFINEAKGIESILEVGKILKQKNMDFKILLIGELNSCNKYHKTLIDLINLYKLQEEIVVTGYLESEEVADYISICDWMIFPFVKGLSPRNGSFLAALLQGVNIITTKSDDYCNFNNINNVFFIDTYLDINSIMKHLVNNKKNIINNSNIQYSWDEIAYKNHNIYLEVEGRGMHEQ